MTKTRNWPVRAIYILVALAMVVGMGIVPTAPAIAGETTEDRPSITPIGFNVKGATHKVEITNLGDWEDAWYAGNVTADWWLGTGPAGVLGRDDITIMGAADMYGMPIDPLSAAMRQDLKDPGTTDFPGNPVRWIEIQSDSPGDIIIRVKLTQYEDGKPVDEITLVTEKKWGRIYESKLDVYDGPDFKNTDTVEWAADRAPSVHKQRLTDTITGDFFEVMGFPPAEGAVVHWWLLDNTSINQAEIQKLMDYLAGDPVHGKRFDYYSATGRYTMTDDFMRHPVTNDPRQAFQWLDDYAAAHQPAGIFSIDPVSGTAGSQFYGWNTSDADGKAQADLVVDVDAMTPCKKYSVMIVVLVSYPGGTTPQDDPHHGENPVAVQVGKKTYHKDPKPEIDDVKTPQLRWAGEKIVLEHDWGVGPAAAQAYWEWEAISNSTTDNYWEGWVEHTRYAVTHWLELESIGNLEPVSAAPGSYIISTPWDETIEYDLSDLLPAGFGAQEVWQEVFGESQVIHSTEQSGQVDVNAALYAVTVRAWAEGHWDGDERIITDRLEPEITVDGPIRNHGFLVYFLALEDVVLSEVTPPASITDLQAGEEDAHVAVEVRGFFDYRNSNLIPTTREARPIDLDGDGTDDVILPAGRYVLPDDWWILAGTRDVSLRPNWDLMDSAHHDNIYSLNPLGPFFDGDDPNDLLPWTTNPPGEARFPTIGPFSTLQQWSNEAMWITEATVPTSLMAVLIDEDERNTVVPDGEIDKWDAPMPPALVMFNIDTQKSHQNASLSTLWKFMLEGYGYTIYDSGTATADGTTTTLTDATKSWTPGELVNGFVRIDRAGEHYYGQITANTATALTFQQVTWPTTLPALPAPGVRSGDAYLIPRFESPFYAVEIPAHAAIPPGYPGWHSWPAGPGGDGPYPFWADLQMESRWNRMPEPDPLSIWVYSDNHGIAGVAIDDLGVEGCVTITATADFPYTPKMGKYGPRVSHDITACWGQPVFPELNPHFVPSKDKVDVDETITFTNLTLGGTLPYTKAVWDFSDGTVITIEGTHDEVMAPVTHAYSAEGSYYVTLTMTDSAPMTRFETRSDPIVVGDPNDDNNDNDFVDNPPIEEAMASIADELVIVLLFQPATQTYDLYFPLTGDDTIGTLEAGRAYWIYVEADCTLEYGTVSIPLYAGWNNPPWPAQ